jgi:hypothetical protein
MSQHELTDFEWHVTEPMQADKPRAVAPIPMIGAC